VQRVICWSMKQEIKATSFSHNSDKDNKEIFNLLRNKKKINAICRIQIFFLLLL